MNMIPISLCVMLMVSMSEALRVLVFFPAPSRSHSILGHGVVNHLLAAGHEVVHVTPYPREKVEGKLKEIDLTNIATYFRSALEKREDFKLKNQIHGKCSGNSLAVYYFMYELHKILLTNEVMKSFLEDPNEKFDVVVAEWFFYNLMAGISPLFKCPLIWFATTEAHWQIMKMVDDIPNPSYNVDIFSTNKPPLSFWQRIGELWNLVTTSIMFGVIFTPLEKSLYASVFPAIAAKRGVTMPSYDEVVYNASFLFINSHPSIGSAFRLPQNARYVGGYHVERKVKPLPKDLKAILDGAPHGVIYFSMGSNLRSTDMSDNMKDSILRMFSTLKQRVIWKFESDLQNVPANVHLVKWAPQQSILAHPNSKIFITHGGQLSTIEAIHHGVPVIGIPVVADQHVNMRSVMSKGFGVTVDLAEDMHQGLGAAIKEVVHVTPYPREKVEGKLKEIDLTNIATYFRSALEKREDFKLKNQIHGKCSGNSLAVYYFMYELHKILLTNEVMKSFLEDPNEKFDVVVAEWFFYNLMAGISPLFKCPLIWFATTEAHWQIMKMVDDIPNPSYNVDIFSTNKPPLSFWQRISELWNLVTTSTMFGVIFTPLEKSLYASVFPAIAAKRGVTMPSYDEVVYNASFLFINSHPSIGSAFRLPQNARYVGGYHVERKVKPLPKDLKAILDGAPYGVIYFSMGSNLRSTDMSDNMKDSILRMFSTLKQRVIWKFESDLQNVPANVHLVKWAPQQSILAHPNLKIFITHGGQLSTIEAIHHGVPVIGIPVVADQHVNMRSVMSKGFGVVVDLAEDMHQGLGAAIKEVLNNDLYRRKAKELSQLYHDRRDPGEEMVYWIEHVVRTKGAPHLQSPALTLPYYQRYYLDLAGAVTTVLMLLIFITKKIVRYTSKPNLTKEKKNK